MKNAEYLAQRMRELEEARHKEASEIADNIAEHYEYAKRSIDEKIRSWYQRLADNNGVSMEEAIKLLTVSELEEFHWDVKQYIAKGKENAISGEWVKQLENASAKRHITHLEAIKAYARQICEEVARKRLEETAREIEKLYTDAYYHTAFEVQKCFGIGWSMDRLDQRRVKSVLSKPWAADGRDFSARIHADLGQTVEVINREITHMLLTGEKPDRAIAEIHKRLGISKSHAATMVYTEGAIFAQAGQKDCYNDLGVEKYIIVETLDSKTCPICGDMDGKIFPMSEWEIGVTAPIFHPRCRGTTAPYFDDMEGTGERFARDVDCKTYNVPANMKYSEWSKETIKNSDISNKNSEILFTNDSNYDIISGGISGARNPYGKAATKHAEQYYAFVRSIDIDCTHIAHNTGIDQKTIELIKQYVFVDSHDLGGEFRRFDSDYMIAQSWQRLMDGKNILPHDLTLLHHEKLEISLVKSGMSQHDAHIVASKKFNFGKEATEYYASLKKYRKE